MVRNHRLQTVLLDSSVYLGWKDARTGFREHRIPEPRVGTDSLNLVNKADTSRALYGLETHSYDTTNLVRSCILLTKSNNLGLTSQVIIH